ncbi:hypothetical protein [Nonomuraea ferruginea]|uniref:Uncharacterized protein n=1 Tax=Nonomuraea ferruginea TaxID=46174 RepID=A0ABT4SZ59_9ACTN|nr:hypothetical protein [Nonomuraea ferruginea]MDA0642538.1 hypothetical protein [Nonomuraea ferruginea]
MWLSARLSTSSAFGIAATERSLRVAMTRAGWPTWAAQSGTGSRSATKPLPERITVDKPARVARSVADRPARTWRAGRTDRSRSSRRNPRDGASWISVRKTAPGPVQSRPAAPR